MGLMFELATFTVKEGKEDALLTERPEMMTALQRAFPGVLGAWLAKRDDGSWVDVIPWRSGESVVPTHRGVPRIGASRGRPRDRFTFALHSPHRALTPLGQHPGHATALAGAGLRRLRPGATGRSRRHGRGPRHRD